MRKSSYLLQRKHQFCSYPERCRGYTMIQLACKKDLNPFVSLHFKRQHLFQSLRCYFPKQIIINHLFDRFQMPEQTSVLTLVQNAQNR